MSDEPIPNLRFGIMCNGTRFPAWQAQAIRHLLDVPGVEAGLLIVRGSPPSTDRLARLKDWRRLLWLAFNKGYVERRSRASRGVDMSDEFDGVATITCATEPAGKYGERFTDADIASIRGQDLDFILRFSFGIIKGDILDAARYGVWSFHHGDERIYRGRPPGFWELVDGEATVGAILQRLTERLDGGVVLHRGAFRVSPHSYRRTRDELFSGSAVWPSIVARTVLSGQTDVVDASPSTTNAPVRRDPGNLQTAAFLLRQAWQFVSGQWRGLTRAAIWTVGVADAPITSFLEGERPKFNWVGEASRGRYLADPFAKEHDGALVALVEDYDYATRRGVISAVDLSGRARDARVVLDAGVHASYPYVFEHNGEVYCVPETYAAGQIRLYRATRFPDEWDLVTTLVDGVPGLDATVFQHDDRWWLLCTRYDDDGNTKLHVWHASDLEGPWEPHPLNPVKTDVRSSRPAGTPFEHEGQLFRPAQDCSKSYGGSLVINRIDELTPTSFSETVVAHVAPPDNGRYGAGIHTLSAVGSRTVADARRDTFVGLAFKHELTSRLKKLRPGG